MKLTEINTIVVCRKNKVINIAKNIYTYKEGFYLEKDIKIKLK